MQLTASLQFSIILDLDTNTDTNQYKINTNTNTNTNLKLEVTKCPHMLSPLVFVKKAFDFSLYLQVYPNVCYFAIL